MLREGATIPQLENWAALAESALDATEPLSDEPLSDEPLSDEWLKDYEARFGKPFSSQEAK